MRSPIRLDSARFGFALRAVRAIPALFAIIACLVSVCSAAPASACADGYRMPRTRIAAVVQENGDLLVTETRRFAFDDAVNGVYWEIPFAVNQQGGTSNVEVGGVEEIDSGAARRFQQVSSAFNGSTGMYTVSRSTQGRGGLKLKVFAPRGEGSSAEFRVSYTLTGAVMAWTDTAELYWQFIGSGWEQNSEDVRLDVTFPEGSAGVQPAETGKNFRAWGHGPLDARVSLDAARPSVHYRVPTVAAGKFAEARIAFPAAWVPGLKIPPKSAASDRLPTILDEETHLAEQANRERAAARELLLSATVLSIGLPAILLAGVVAFRLIRGRGPRPVFQETYFRDVPSPDHPAVISAFMNRGSVRDAAIVSTLMRLTDDKIIALDAEHDERQGIFRRKGVDTYAMRLLDRARATDPIDAAALALYFGADASDGAHVSFDEIKALAHDDPKGYNRRLDDLRSEVSASLEVRGFIASTGTALKITVSVLASLMLLLVLLFAFAIHDVSFIAISVSAVIMLVAAEALAVTYRRYSQEGVELRVRCRALKKWLEDFTRLGEAVPADLILWNKLLVMGVALGVSEEVLRRLADAVPRELRETDQGTYLFPLYWWLYPHAALGSPMGAMHAVYTAAIADIASSANSSGGGFGGGFSGGGGGGIGGGGGGTF